MFKGKVVAFALMLLFATSVFAGDVDDCNSTAGISCSARMTVNICPFGDFQFIRDGCTPTGAQYIWIEARTATYVGHPTGDPIPGIPWTDYWLNACDSAKWLYMCASPIVADSLTGTNGRTTFGGRIAGGGCTIPAGSLTGSGIYMAIQGKVIKAHPCGTSPLCLSVDIKSPDLTGNLVPPHAGGPDGQVNASDLVPFGSSYNCFYGVPNPPKAYNACCDYVGNEVPTRVNLSDLAFFGTHYQHKCQ